VAVSCALLNVWSCLLVFTLVASMLLLPVAVIVCKPLVKKGLATEIIQLLEPHVRSTHPKLVTNTAYCMMQLISTEQRLLQQEQEEQQGDHQQQQQDKQQDKQEQQEVLPPVLSAVLAHADLKCFLAAMGPEAQGSCPGNFYQAITRFG